MKVLDQLNWNKPITVQNKEGKDTVTTVKAILENPIPFGRANADAAQAMAVLFIIEHIESIIAREEIGKPKLHL
jgi:hypothetical protein